MHSDLTLCPLLVLSKPQKNDHILLKFTSEIQCDILKPPLTRICIGTYVNSEIKDKLSLIYCFYETKPNSQVSNTTNKEGLNPYKAFYTLFINSQNMFLQTMGGPQKLHPESSL